jgi:hypothetical protein
MKRAVAILAIVALAVLAFPSAALAATFQSSGRVAYAFADVLAEGAETPEVSVGVFVGDQISKSHLPGTKADRFVGTSADVLIDWWEPSAEGIYRAAYLSVSPYDAGIDRFLTTAALHADLEGFLVEYTLEPCPDEPDCYEGVIVSETPITGRADFDWAATGDLQKYRFRMQEWGMGHRWFDRSAGSYRTAAVSGTLTVDGVDLPEGLEYYGEISSGRSMSIVHGDPFIW